jgi:hypothetical protein
MRKYLDIPTFFRRLASYPPACYRLNATVGHQVWRSRDICHL